MSVTDAEWIEDYDLKVVAAARLIRLATPALIESKAGSIVNVLSIAAKAPGTFPSTPSSVSRAAGMALTKAVANELAPHNVRANAVLIGLIDSSQWIRMAQERGIPLPELMEDLVARAKVPMGRIGRGAEFGDLASYLLSARSSYVTGTAINLDGGASPAV